MALTRWIADAGTKLTLLSVACGFCFLAVGFFAAALYLALAGPLPPSAAAGVTGLALVLVAALIVLGIRLSLRGPRRAPAQPASPPDGRVMAAKLGEMLGEDVAGWTRRHPAAAMIAALAAGFAVGSSPKLRSELSRFL